MEKTDRQFYRLCAIDLGGEEHCRRHDYYLYRLFLMMDPSLLMGLYWAQMKKWQHHRKGYQFPHLWYCCPCFLASSGAVSDAMVDVCMSCVCGVSVVLIGCHLSFTILLTIMSHHADLLWSGAYLVLLARTSSRFTHFHFAPSFKNNSQQPCPRQQHSPLSAAPLARRSLPPAVATAALPTPPLISFWRTSLKKRSGVNSAIGRVDLRS